MGLQVVGVGMGRTGTTSLKLALEQLLGGRCHHMAELFEHPEQVALWTAAATGAPDWPTTFDGYVATVDWPGAAFWRQLVVAYPDALVLLSRRESADAWWTSAHRTIFEAFDGTTPLPPPMKPWFETMGRLLAEAGIDPADPAVSKAAYERHLVDVRAEVPADRLVEWMPGDGWEPLCAALSLPVPDEPFPHLNTTDEFRARFRDRTAT